MNRSVGVALRHTPGAGILTALGLATIAPSVPVTVASAMAQTSHPSAAMLASDPQPQPARLRVVHDPGELVAVAIPVARQGPAVALGQQPSMQITYRVSPTPSSSRAPAPSARVVGPASGGANGFTYGYCTWWVAHKRYIPWRGNAWEWWGAARAYGFAEGYAPRVGAIMVMGISGTSPSGHVAYVEAVYGNGTFLVSEMNWWGVPGGGWGRVDYRTVTSMRGIIGFIY